MFREILLATTALLAVGSVTPTEAQNVAGANASHAAALHLASAVAAHRLDKNTEFLCAYGGYDVEAYEYASSEYWASNWTHVAVPIRGHGRTVNRIIVENGTSDYHKSRGFSVAIYNNTPSGTPGGLIAGATSRANHQCRQLEVNIPSTVLDDGKKYWVVESVPRPEWSRDKSKRKSVTWGIDPVAREDAYSQYHTYVYAYPSGSRSSTSPWTPIKGRAPFVRVK